ncbi:ABC transporter substrate-binding protein [Nocardioides yefusunii]|uniref:ABC transporter substrate-binding protein n=1 Tax=Nocardioides yefusunii TaxID=2500546 RepID=A0ABW1QV00_9ACTN|nr:ABC transporter substrate-binding protein [Nocardioides yefusunii]
MKFIQRPRGTARRSVGLAAVAVMGLSLVTACGGGNDTASGEKITDLVIDVASEPDSLDPFYRNAAAAGRFYRLAYSSLLQWNEDGTTTPDLAAEAPTVSEDRLTWTVKLKEGITFHDGTPLTADDVVHTVAEAQEKENASVWLSALTYVTDVKAVDDLTVEFTLSEPYAYFESKLAMLPIISDEDEYKVNDTYATTENGSGPYKLVKLSRGSKIEMERFEDYHGDDYAFETITFNVVPEDASRIANLTNGKTHIVPDLPAEQVDLVTKRGANAEVIEANVSRLFAYPSMNADRPTSNTDFRLALANAVDRDKIVQQVYDGAGRANATYLTYGTLFHDEALGQAFGGKPDLAKAKEYLKKSGVKLDRKLSIIADKSKSQTTSAATILQANLKAIGIESTVEAMEIAGFYEALVTGEYDLIMFDSPASSSTGFAPDYVNGGLNSTAANNFAKFKDAEMDKLLDAALTAPDEASQAAAWKAVQQRDVETQGNIQITVSQAAQGWSKDLEGYEPSNLMWFNTLRNVK